MKTPAEKIADFAYSTTLDFSEGFLCQYKEEGKSPIEALLYCALTTVLRLDGHFDDVECEASALREVGIEMQRKVEKFLVDFVVSIRNDRTGKLFLLAVECDGHEFHERTKDQAKKDRSRDRRLQQLGFTIYRFTGAEIYADPIHCAHVVMEWLYACSWVRD